jgi:hypothetical protein
MQTVEDEEHNFVSPPKLKIPPLTARDHHHVNDFISPDIVIPQNSDKRS